MASQSQDRQAQALEDCATHLNRVADTMEKMLAKLEEKAKPAAAVVPAPLKAAASPVVVPAVPKPQEAPAGK